MTLRPESVRATQCYVGRGLKGGYFGGSIERFTVHSVPLMDRTPPTPNPAAFLMAPQVVAPSRVALTAAPGSDPLGVVEYYFEQEGATWNSGWMKENNIRVDTKSVANPPRYRVKMRDTHGNETKFSTLTKADALKGAAVLKVTPDTPAVIEAENYSATVPALDGVCKWEKQTQPPGFVGEGYMAVMDRGMVNEPCAPTAARLDYPVNFTRSGKYWLWVRGNGNNDGGQSIHVGLGLKTEEWGTNLRIGSGRYTWTKSKPIQVDTPGLYVFSIWMHQDGAMVDRFLFTANEQYEPEPGKRAADKALIGEGPAESQR